MPTARFNRTSAHSLLLPRDPRRAKRVQDGWDWKRQWREAMTHIPFDQKLAILRGMWDDNQQHPMSLD